MRLRIFTEPQQGASYEQLLGVATSAEALGFDAFFRSDHYLVMGAGDGLPGPSDAWTTLAGIARETSQIRLGTLMTSATFRLPGPLAITVAGVDAMSGGRVELGLGAGWYEAEHDAYGIAFPSTVERFDRLEEQLAVISGLWDTPDGLRFSFSGAHYRLENCPALPKPRQRPRPPLIVGGHGKVRTPRLAAEYAAEFNEAFRPLAETTVQFDRVRRACETAGRDPSTMVYSAAQVVCCGATSGELEQRAHTIGRQVDELRANGLCGTPAEVVDQIATFAKAGVQTLYLQFLTLDDLGHLDLIGTEVLPEVSDL